jgi:hypothetical protein
VADLPPVAGWGEIVRVVNAAVQRRAAELVGKGATRKEAAAAVGVCERTVREWLKKPELAAIAHQTRQDTLDPTVAGAFREALGAVTRDGRPDYAIRLRAAAELAKLEAPATGSAPHSGVVQVVMYMPDEEADVECPNCGYTHRPFKLDEPPPPLDPKPRRWCSSQAKEGIRSYWSRPRRRHSWRDRKHARPLATSLFERSQTPRKRHLHAR